MKNKIRIIKTDRDVFAVNFKACLNDVIDGHFRVGDDDGAVLFKEIYDNFDEDFNSTGHSVDGLERSLKDTMEHYFRYLCGYYGIKEEDSDFFYLKMKSIEIRRQIEKQDAPCIEDIEVLVRDLMDERHQPGIAMAAVWIMNNIYSFGLKSYAQIGAIAGINETRATEQVSRNLAKYGFSKDEGKTTYKDWFLSIKKNPTGLQRICTEMNDIIASKYRHLFPSVFNQPGQK